MLRPSFLLPAPALECRRLACRESFMVPTPSRLPRYSGWLQPSPWSRLPARVLRPGGARPGPTEAGAETGSRQSATGARSPPSHAPTMRRRVAYRHGRGRQLYSLIRKGGAFAVSPAGSVGRWTRATGTQRPPLATPHFKGTARLAHPAGETRGWGGWHRRPGKSLHKGRSGIIRMSFPTLALAWKTAPRKPRRVSEANG